YPHFLGLHAEALGIGGRFDEGLDVLSRALDRVDETGERYYEAELHRLRGELLLKRSDGNDRSAEVDDCFRAARDIAGRQKALALEFRAAISTAHLAMSRGRHSEARSMLEPLSRRFTEGFDTVDWREAAGLLADN